MKAAIIQARMGSTRLPGKVLADIAGKPMIQRVFERVKAAKLLDKVILATTREESDLPLVTLGKNLDVEVFQGSLNDVLDRYFQAARFFGVKIVVRITGDCPLVDPVLIDRAIAAYLEGDFDYVSTAYPVPTFPDGVDVEVFSFQVLEGAWRKATLKSEREHVTPYIWKNPHIFRLKSVVNPEDLSALRWTVDEERDLKFVREVYRRLEDGKTKIFGMDQVLGLLKRHPEISMINQGIRRNEGYEKSLEGDRRGLEEGHEVRSRRLEKAFEYLRRAEKVIPAVTQTLSKGPTQFIQGVAPIYLKRGKGSHVWDVDGNEYIDYPGALGPIILGYAYPATIEAVTKQLRDGITFSLMHPLEVEVAELLVELIPCAEMVRFSKNGSDVTSAAIRVSRAYTGRDKVATCGYHGTQDWFIASTSRDRGVPKFNKKLIYKFGYNEIETLEKIFAEHPEEIAAVILEPITTQEPKDNFLHKVKDWTHRNGAVLIFDEVKTGFRVAMGGAQEYYSVVPDLACFGKAMANGMPLSALVGCRDIMKELETVFFSMTFGGEVLSLAACVSTLQELREKDVLGHLWRQGEKLKDGYNRLVKEIGLEGCTQCVGLPSKSFVEFYNGEGADALSLKSLFQQEVIKRGVLFNGEHMLNFSHSDEDIDKTVVAYGEALSVLGKALNTNTTENLLEGKRLRAVFAER